MHIDFYATLRQIVGTKTVEFRLNGDPTVRHLIQEMISRYPSLRAELLDENEQIHGHVHININGRNVPFLENGMDTVLSPDDTVSIFPAVGGG